MSNAADAIERGCEFAYHLDDEPLPKTADWAEMAASGILADLTDRKGIRHELEACDSETRVEIFETITMIIRLAVLKAKLEDKL